METIGVIADDFITKNEDTLNKHKNDFLAEINQGRQAETKQHPLSVDELVLGAISGMAEGFWLKRQQQPDSPN
jgi:hypothetical protein